MADYTIQLSVTFSGDIDAKELQAGLSDHEARRRFGDLLSSVLVLPAVPQRQKYPKAGTFSVGSVTVEKK